MSDLDCSVQTSVATRTSSLRGCTTRSASRHAAIAAKSPAQEMHPRSGEQGLEALTPSKSECVPQRLPQGGTQLANLEQMSLVKLRCRCGSVLGSLDLSRPSRVRVVCHCGDCSAYARHIGSALATQIVQVTPDQLTIRAGREHLRCLRLTERGLTRWFMACCKTPLANTSRHAWLPFVGVMSCVLEIEDESRVGPAVHANGAHPTPWATVFRSLWALLRGFLFRRHRPNPFFDERGRPIVEPQIIA
ncbi:MAG TPA: DUF6151 family protein [Polyangiaceae bacterium]|nr:DUF6151 family protein [Polyangiaceae bacterium]